MVMFVQEHAAVMAMFVQENAVVMVMFVQEDAGREPEALEVAADAADAEAGRRDEGGGEHPANSRASRDLPAHASVQQATV